MPSTVANMFWIVDDTTPTTNVYSTATNTFIANNSASFLAWLTSGEYGFAQPILGMASNAGAIQITIPSTTPFQTGQRWRVQGQVGQAAATGNWPIAVNSATQITLTGSTYNGSDVWVSGGFIQGAQKALTLASLNVTINGFNIGAAVPNTGVFTGSAAVVLTNPLASRVSINFTASGTTNVTLPIMNAPNSIPIGSQIEIRNDGQFAFTLKDNGGTNVVNIVSPNTAVDIVLVSNATANGTFLITTKTINIFSSFIGRVKGLKAFNNVASPNTKLDITATSWQSGIGSRPAFVSSPAQLSVSVLDTGLAGPAVNGRDQSGVFTASQWLHVFAIGKNSEVGDGTMRCIITTDFTGPVLPTGYQYYAYLFSVYWTAGSILSAVTVRGNLVSYNAAPRVLSSGAATVETAISLATNVPPIANNVSVVAYGQNLNTTNVNSFSIRHTTGSNLVSIVTTQATGAIGQWSSAGFLAPNVSQNLYYIWGLASGSGSVDILGYTVPNGDS